MKDTCGRIKLAVTCQVSPSVLTFTLQKNGLSPVSRRRMVFVAPPFDITVESVSLGGRAGVH